MEEKLESSGTQQPHRLTLPYIASTPAINRANYGDGSGHMIAEERRVARKKFAYRILPRAEVELNGEALSTGNYDLEQSRTLIF